MAAGGIDGILLTSPIMSASKAAHVAALTKSVQGLMVAIDHVRQVEMYEQAAAAIGAKLDVLIDLNVGDRRTGATPGEPAVALAHEVMKNKHLRLRGVQAYSGGSSHVMGFAARRAHSQK